MIASTPRLIIFDLDGTLAPSKSFLTEGIADLLRRLLKEKSIAVISGASFIQFSDEFLSRLKADTSVLSRLFILPTNGAELYTYENGNWVSKYSKKISEEQKSKIISTLNHVLSQHIDLLPKHTVGKTIEDRGNQITFSALGQQALIKDKALWDPNQDKRRIIRGQLYKLLPDFSISIGGMTSIDITEKGVDKAFGIREVCKTSGFDIKDSIYVGDAIYPDGNDAPALETGIAVQKVLYPSDTALFIRKLLNLEHPEKLFDKRPWGEFEEFSKNIPQTVKIIIIEEGQKLSLQYHSKRSEFWKVISGSPQLTIDAVVMDTKPGDEFWIERFSEHRMASPKGQSKILEISFGEFNEEDIIRIEDIYGRISQN